ncbi:heterokaryon incompatibility protein-domain-containing protein [Echria macrotheca]|uniref:Heterokaryon incompatibility protein-domain-containing protein n=1 Tax=Echria macrotheca TaxID=438768 RepID=A0AAJ0F7Q4_9PEZI|nr:heterokaryon incompatibility protein-domain-containing protein [Echria macrotheca]
MSSDSGSDFNPDADDWDELVTDNDWEEHDVFRPPTCPNPSCTMRNSGLYTAGDLSVCLDCRFIIPSATSLLGHITAFPYVTLQQELELRLLLVWPQREDEDEIHGTLVHCHVNDHLEYEAISYTWADEHGDASRDRTIFLNDLPLAVTSSCVSALKRVRLISAPRVIWIDAVCVNQDDMNERGHQVRLMPEIYSRAKRVLICLGDASEDDSTGIYFLSSLKPFAPIWRIYDRPNVVHSEQWWDLARNAVQKILAHRYFTRVWILQEIGLAKDAVVLYGEQEMPWKLLQQSVVVTDTKWHQISSSFSLPFLRPLAPKGLRLPMAFSFASATIRGPDQMLELLDDARKCHASDPRDKVFALFGLVQLASKFGFAANYTETIAEAYTRIAVLLAVRNGLLPILRRATTWERQQQALPCWVPDWSPSSDLDDPSVTSDSDAPVPVLASNGGYGLDVIGARICDLETFIYAGFKAKIETAGPTQYVCRSGRDLLKMYETIGLRPGSSLGCYTLRSLPDHQYTAQSFQTQLQNFSETPITKIDFLTRQFTKIDVPKRDLRPRQLIYECSVFREPEAGESRKFVGRCMLITAPYDIVDGVLSVVVTRTRKVEIPEKMTSLEMATCLERRFLEKVDEHMGRPGANDIDPSPRVSRPTTDDRPFWIQVWNHFLPASDRLHPGGDTIMNDEAVTELLSQTTTASPPPAQVEIMEMPSLYVAEQFNKLTQHGPSPRTCLKILRYAIRLKRPRTAVDHGRHGQLGGPDAWLNAWAERELSGLGEVLDTVVGANLVRLAQISPGQWQVDLRDGSQDSEENSEGDKGRSLFKDLFKHLRLLDEFLGDEELEYQRITFGMS